MRKITDLQVFAFNYGKTLQIYMFIWVRVMEDDFMKDNKRGVLSSFLYIVKYSKTSVTGTPTARGWFEII